MENLWLAVITLIFTILCGCISIITTIIVAVWKITNRFTAIEVRMAGLEQITLAQNHRLEMMESKDFKPIARRK